MRVWVIRHGESETNKNKLWTGWLDAPLTEKGKEDAALVNKLVSKINFDKIYSSDLSRAKSTADIAIPGCTYEATEMLREINVGNIAGKPLNEATAGKYGYGSFGGESYDAFRNRISAFIKRLETESYENIAVFSHAGVLRKFLEITLGVQPMQGTVICKNCAVAIFDVDSSVWRLHSWINLY